MDNLDKPVTCRKCNTTYVPTLFNDFYPDEEGGATGRCERCMMTEEFCTPTPIPDDAAESRCRFRQGKDTCAFLMFGAGGFTCAKGSISHNNTILKRWRAGEMSAQGNHCWGPPSFKPMSPEDIEQHRNGKD